MDANQGVMAKHLKALSTVDLDLVKGGCENHADVDGGGHSRHFFRQPTRPVQHASYRPPQSSQPQPPRQHDPGGIVRRGGDSAIG